MKSVLLVLLRCYSVVQFVGCTNISAVFVSSVLVLCFSSRLGETSAVRGIQGWHVSRIDGVCHLGGSHHCRNRASLPDIVSGHEGILAEAPQ